MDAPLPVLLSHPQPKEDPGPEFYEDNSEECLNYNIDKENEKINKAMFDDLGLNKEDEQSNIIDNFKKLYSEFSVQKKKKHIPSVDPYTKIKLLEKELQITTKEVQEYIDYYKDNLLLKEAENFDSVLKDLDTYRKKLDILMNSDAYKKSKGDNVDIKKEIKANLEQYTKSTSLLLNQIAKQKKDIQSGNIEGLNINYELMMEFDEDPNKIEMNFKEIEDKITLIEKEIGEWDKFKNPNSLFDEVDRLIVFCDTKLEKNQDTRDRLMSSMNELLDHFVKEKNTCMEISNYFIKIKELYSMLELYESFESVFEYIKRRLKAIKAIHENSDKFSSNVKILNNKLEKNEKEFKVLGEKYNSTLTEFSKIEEIVKEVNSIQEKINKMLIQ